MLAEVRVTLRGTGFDTSRAKHPIDVVNPWAIIHGSHVPFVIGSTVKTPINNVFTSYHVGFTDVKIFTYRPCQMPDVDETLAIDLSDETLRSH